MSDGRLETVLVEGRGVELPTAVHLPYHKQTTLGDWSVCPYVCTISFPAPPTPGTGLLLPFFVDQFSKSHSNIPDSPISPGHSYSLILLTHLIPQPLPL